MNSPFLVQHFLENSARRFPDKVALIYGDRRLTYSEINDMADLLAYSLVEMGVKRGDRVAIFLDSSVESVISMFGILKIGAIFIMLSPTLKPKKLNYILGDSGAITLITQSNKIRIVEQATEGVAGLKNIVWTGKPPKQSNAKLGIKNYFWAELITQSQDSPHKPLASIVDLDLATIIYTSGSTGDPKGVMSAHYNVIAAAASITTYLENTEDDIIFNTLPLSFDYGLYQVLMAFLVGGTIVIEKSFLYPYRVLERLVQERATGFPIVPTMAAVLLQMRDLNRFDFSCLRYITNTAAALPVSHIRKLQELFPDTKIYSMYGLTECKRVSYLPPDELNVRPDSVGLPMPNEEVFIVDSKGREVGPDEIGELVVRGSNVMQGYWNAPQETKLCFKPGKRPGETLLYTGDLFSRDNDGFLYFVGRTDDMIKTKGERVSPKEIENCLCELKGVSAAAVIGVPDEMFGQAIMAFVVLEKRVEMDESNVLRHCQKNLESFMVPKYIEFKKQLPKTSSGKVDKKRLA
jgi:amino acid adenylation domain-containing protein